MMESVAVEGPGLPVLDLDVAGAFGGAAVLHRLNGRRSALSWRLEGEHKRESFKTICPNSF